MASLGNYSLVYADARGPAHSEGRQDLVSPCDQFVFATKVDVPVSLRRVRSFQDVVQALSDGGHRSMEGFAVALLALLLGNLVAVGHWLQLLAFVILGVLAAVCELRAATLAGLLVLTALLLDTAYRGQVSVRWLATVALVVVSALLALLIGETAVRTDPRSYAVLREEEKGPSSCRIRNDCCMDVKVLVFDGEDVVRLVPQGGLLGGTLVPRGAVHCVGLKPPYVVKAYAPWELELGSWLLQGGLHTLRATAPPLLLLPGEPEFLNSSEAPVLLCWGGGESWACSLWLPLAPQLARLLWPRRRVRPGEAAPLPAPCVLRIFGASGLGSLVQHACCSVHAGERVEHLGCVTWSRPPRGGGAPSVHRSCSSVLADVH